MNNDEPQVVIRDNAVKMMKHGRWRAYRNIPVGWITQSIHSTDKSELLFRLLFEAIVLMVVTYYLYDSSSTGVMLLVTVFVCVHSIFWFLFGSFWVYMLDSFDWVENGGISNVIRFTRFVKRVYSVGDSSEAILIYGSMARSRFHNGSDLDLRILRRTDSFKGLFALVLAAYVKAYAFVIRMPVDLQVVDSFEFLQKQMRADELPIVVYKRDSAKIPEAGPEFSSVEDRPESVLRDNASEK